MKSKKNQNLQPLPSSANVSVVYEDGYPVLKIDNLKKITQNSVAPKMSARKKDAWQKRLKAIVEKNEYYQQFCDR